jgi:hypothetical protein
MVLEVFPVFSGTAPSYNNSPSYRYISVANLVSQDFDIIRKSITSLIQIIY